MYNKTKHKDQKKFWMNCLQCFSSKEILTNHPRVCLEINGGQASQMQKGSNIMFTGHHKQLKTPFATYDDFKSILKKV